MRNLSIATVIYLVPYLVYGINSDNTVKTVNTFCYLTPENLKKFKSNQITIITDSGKDNDMQKNTNLLLQCISLEKSVILMSLASLTDTRNDYITHQFLSHDFDYNTLFIVILSVESHEKQHILSKFMGTLDFITNLSPNMAKPNCLLITHYSWLPTSKSNELLLVHAWQKRFLDVTILQCAQKNVSCEYRMTVAHYNPFTDRYYSHCFTPSMDIFPKKLQNMYGYPLKVSVLKVVVRPPAVNFERNSSGYPININGPDWYTMLCFSTKMNFSIILVAPNVTAYDELIPGQQNMRTFDLIERGNIDLSGNQMFLYFYPQENYRRLSEQSIVSYFDDLIVVVPVFLTRSWKMQIDTLLMLLGIGIHVIMTYVIARILKFNFHYWLPYRIFHMFLGIPASRLPSKISERIFFATLISISLQYSTIVFAKFAGLRLTGIDDGPFHSLEDLNQSDIIVEVRSVYKKSTLHENGDILGNVFKKVKFVNDVPNCPSRVLKNQNVACLIDKSIAMKIIESNRDYRNKIKIMDYVFLSIPKGFIYSKASPYAPEFNRLLKRIYESGFWQTWLISDKKWKSTLNKEIIFSPDIFLKYKLMIILFGGSAISIIGFIGELIICRYRKKDKTHQL